MISHDDDVLFFDNMILLSNGTEIMMSWETPIMYKMADEVCKNKGYILEVGFGMGISANRIQMNNPEKHVIVEINKHIFKKAEEWSIDKKNVILIEGDIVDFIKNTDMKFDGILWDPYPSDIISESDKYMYDDIFLNKLKRISNIGCRISPFFCGGIQRYIEEDAFKHDISKIEVYEIELYKNIKTQYFQGDKADVVIINI